MTVVAIIVIFCQKNTTFAHIMKKINHILVLGCLSLLVLPVTLSATNKLPDTTYLSAKKLQYVVETKDKQTSALLTNMSDLYDKAPGVFTFRGTSRRDMAQCGKLDSVPTRIRRVWTFNTAVDNTETPYGTWGGGTGWTGQPLYVEWPDSLVEKQRKTSGALTANFSSREIIVGSLCGRVYFIDYNSGKASRQSHKSGNPIKGTPSLDPRLNGNLYVGQGIPTTRPFGAEVFNLFSHKRISFFDVDAAAWRGWGAYDPSAVVVDNFVLRASENGTIYKLIASESKVRTHSLLRYCHRGYKTAGIESSPAVWKNYLFVADNRGNILAINIETMKPVWHYDNLDDSDATIVVAEEKSGVFLYSGTAVDKQGESGYCRFVKLNAENGSLVWERKIACKKINYLGKMREGGMFASPLLGHGNCEGLIFTNICGMGSAKGTFVAIDRASGEIKYQTALKHYSWSSPVAFYTPKGEMFIFTGDVIGTAYLIEAATGKIIYRMQGGNNFEASPIVVDNCVVIGSRGREIHKFEIY
jgi:outer membrane protein assembly factor BamB